MNYYINALIINWNGTDDTKELVTSLIHEQSYGLTIDVYIIDNGSLEENYQKLSEFIDLNSRNIYIKLIRNKDNLGVPAAYNQAISAARNQDAFFLRLDNDIVILPGKLVLLCEALERQRGNKVGIVGCNTRFYSDINRNDSGAGYINLKKGVTWRTFPDHDVICDGVQGCIMLIEPALIRVFYPNVFDEWLFVMTDESELSIKAANLGYKTFYVHVPVALHKAGMSSSKIGDLITYYAIRNWCYISLKYGCIDIKNSVMIHARLALTVIYHILKPKNDKIRYLKIKAIIHGFQKRYN